MNQPFRKRLLAGDLLLGTMVTLGSPEAAEVLAQAGFDWLFLDAEHGPLAPLDMQRMMQAAGREMPCLVRLEQAGEVVIKKALDVGAAGIIAPMVNSAEMAEQVVSWAKYAPQGKRGVGLGRVTGYGFSFQEAIDGANEATAVVVQAEHITAVENIEAIAAVEGVDAVLIGPYDLSASVGKIGQVGDPAVQEAIDHVTRTCLAAGMPLGIFGLSAAAVRPYIERGYTLVAAGVDTLMLGNGAREILQQLGRERSSGTPVIRPS